MNDLISRQAAIDAIKGLEFCHYMEFGEYIGEDTREVRLIRAEKAQDALQKLPSAQPSYTEEQIQTMQDLESAEIEKAYELGRESAQPQWIPCRETVDIPDHEILACDKYGEEMFGYLSYEDDQWLCVSDDCMMYDPIAWREKPEPYRGRR